MSRLGLRLVATFKVAKRRLELTGCADHACVVLGLGGLCGRWFSGRRLVTRGRDQQMPLAIEPGSLLDIDGITPGPEVTRRPFAGIGRSGSRSVKLVPPDEHVVVMLKKPPATRAHTP